MRHTRLPAVAIALLIPALLAAQSAPAKKGAAGGGNGASPEEYAAADIRISTPGIIYNGGLLDLAASYTKMTGKKIAVRTVIMGGAAGAYKTGNPPSDLMFLPFDTMNTLVLEGGAVPGTYVPVGRSEMGLAVKAGAAHPDISSLEKFAAVLKGAQLVMRSDPSHGSMVAQVIEDKIIKRPEFAGVHNSISTQGEGGQALARGEGDMALQAICEIYPHKEIELVGPAPRELGAWIDMAGGVNIRAQHKDDAIAFLKYIMKPEFKSIWHAKGTETFN